MSHRRLSVLASVAAVLSIALSPLGAAAHVNRTAGPYAFLLFLVEEPTFQDNHAGFEFWVRKGDAPLDGLEAVLRAEAAGHGHVVELAIDPVDASGFYVVDHSPDGTAFDPLGGGDWTLTLTGAIESNPVSVQFPVRFPSYPRIGSPQPVPVDAAANPTGGLPWLVAAVAVVLAAVVWLAVISRRISQRRGR